MKRYFFELPSLLLNALQPTHIGELLLCDDNVCLFLQAKGINWLNETIVECYMVMGDVLGVMVK